MKYEEVFSGLHKLSEREGGSFHRVYIHIQTLRIHTVECIERFEFCCISVTFGLPELINTKTRDEDYKDE